MSETPFREDARYRILRIIREQPHLTQRQISKELGISLGGVNYCLKGLVEKGLVKTQNVRRNPNKLQYVYLLTPKGISVKSTLTANFLQRRMKEYEALRGEIDALEEEIRSVSGAGGKTS